MSDDKMSPGLAAMFEALSASAENEPPTADETAAALDRWFERVIEPPVETFTAGELVIHRLPDLADFRGAERPMMFSHYLNEPLEEHDLSCFEAGKATRHFDCVLLNYHNGHIFAHLHDSSQFTLYNPEA